MSVDTARTSACATTELLMLAFEYHMGRCLAASGWMKLRRRRNALLLLSGDRDS